MKGGKNIANVTRVNPGENANANLLPKTKNTTASSEQFQELLSSVLGMSGKQAPPKKQQVAANSPANKPQADIQANAQTQKTTTPVTQDANADGTATQEQPTEDTEVDPAMAQAAMASMQILPQEPTITLEQAQSQLNITAPASSAVNPVTEQIAMLNQAATEITAPTTLTGENISAASAQPAATPDGVIVSAQTIIGDQQVDTNALQTAKTNDIAQPTTGMGVVDQSIASAAEKLLQQNPEQTVLANQTQVVKELAVDTEKPQEQIPPAQTETPAPASASIVASKQLLNNQRPLKQALQEDDSIVNLTKKSNTKAAENALATPLPQRQIEQQQVQTVQPEQAKPIPQTEQIRTQIVQNLADQKMEFRMQLNPVELGKLDVRMAVDSGRLVVEIIASSAKSAELLSRQMETLASTLNAGNLQVDSIKVVTMPGNASGYMQSAFDLNNGAQTGSEQQQQNNNSKYTKYSGENSTNFGTNPEQANAPSRLLNYSI